MYDHAAPGGNVLVFLIWKLDKNQKKVLTIIYFCLFIFQIAFWGNPITSGSLSIDYFVSADVMEHPYRTRMPVAHEPYSEQLVLMEGQGIWYLRPDIEVFVLTSILIFIVYLLSCCISNVALYNSSVTSTI